MNVLRAHKIPNRADVRPYVPQGLLMQWHLTQRCNLRCAHCYQENGRSEELPMPGLLKILKQYNELLDYMRYQGKLGRVSGHVTVTGGEPFVRGDFLDLLEILASQRARFSFAVLTNGTFIDARMAQRLRKLKPAFVQVSVEGGRATHDQIRGKGNFETTVSAIRHLVRARIRTLISFTATRLNFREFRDVASLGQRLRVSRVWADRCIPCGNGAALREQLLTPSETREFFEMMKKARNRAARGWFRRTEVALQRSLQFLVGGGRPYHCTAGDSLITVQPNGDLLPCRRMPIPVGNVLRTPLRNLYYESQLFRDLRDRNRVSMECENCSSKMQCRGGLKCLSYAVTGDPFKPDPGCWLARKETSKLPVIHGIK